MDSQPLPEQTPPLNIIIPAHNEEQQIAACIDTLTKLQPNAAITVSTDGNTDNTAAIAQQKLTKYPTLFVLNYPNRLGKGGAIKQSIIHDTINIYTDADLAADPNMITPMTQLAKTTGGLIIAKRNTTNRNLKRTIASKTYNSIVRLLFRTGVADHQCGLKVLSPQATRIAATVESDDFFFDTELIIRCKRVGIPIIQVACTWTEHKQQSTVHLYRDSKKMLKQLLKLKLSDVFGKL